MQDSFFRNSVNLLTIESGERYISLEQVSCTLLETLQWEKWEKYAVASYTILVALSSVLRNNNNNNNNNNKWKCISVINLWNGIPRICLQYSSDKESRHLFQLKYKYLYEVQVLQIPHCMECCYEQCGGGDFPASYIQWSRNILTLDDVT